MEAIKLCRLDTPIIFIEARINLSRFVVTGCAAKTSATVTFPSLNLISLFAFCFNTWLNGFASYPSLVSWIKHSVHSCAFRRVVREFFRFTGPRHPAEITPQDVQRWRDGLITQKKSASTVA